jgi:signal transduction histidine kinase/ligand-binding sensor domain-containing protein
MRSVFTLGWFILVATAALGAEKNTIGLRRSHDIWDRASGFPGGYIYSIAQTADGYLWVGTSNGLLRYDGLSFGFIQLANSLGATKEPIEGLVTDSSDHLWAIDNYTHLLRYEAGLLQEPLPNHGLRQLAITVGKTIDGWLLFVSSQQGIVEYHRGEPRVLLEARQLPGEATAVAQTADGTIWIGTLEKGLFHFNPGKGDQDLHRVPGLADEKINCLLPIANTTLIIGTNKGLFVLNNDNLISENLPELENNEILALAGGQHGEIWIGTDGQVLKAQAKDTDAEGQVHSLEVLDVNGTVTALFDDRDSNLWIGEPEAIERFRDSSFVSYLSSAGLPCTNCGSIYVDPHQRVWFAPRDGGLFRISQGRIQSIEIAGLKDDTVYSITGSHDEVWIARRYGGLTRLLLRGDGLEVSTYSKQSGLAENSVYSVYREPNGTVWAGTLNRGLSRFRDGRWRTFTTRDGLPSNRISAITGNASGEIFAGTPNGLAVFRNDRWISYGTHDGLPPGAIESLLFDSTNTLWIGTSRGVAFLSSGAVHVPLDVPNALYEDILGMAEYHDWLWITTPDHVLRIRRSALQTQKFAEGDYREFGVADGLASAEGLKRPGTIVLDNNGSIWFSMNRGISILPPSAFAGPALPVAIRIDGMLIDGKAVATGEEVRVPSGRHRLTFQYTGVNVSNPEGVKYHYRLNEVDSGWSESTSQRAIDFTNLLPGQYQFRVAASNPDGVWSPHEAVIGFRVEPSMLQTRWIQLAFIGALVLIALGIYRLRIQQLQRQFDIGLEARVNERTRIARDLHDTLLQSFQGLMLRLQLVEDLLPEGKARDQLEQTLQRADQAIREGRRAVYDLRSSTATPTDLAQAVRLLGDEFATENSAAFHLVVEGAARDLNPVIRDELYLITREALRNAFSHARANHIEAEITYGERAFRLRIRDDGEGIPPQVLEEGRPGHYGLSGMRERARQVGGKLDFWSKAGAGTEIELCIPGSIAYRPSVARSLFALFGKKAG